MYNMPFSIIAGAHSTNMAIGSAGKIPWKCRADMNFFKEMTSKTKDPTKVNAIVMGRTTYMSMWPGLPNRLNIVLTKKPYLYESKNEKVVQHVMFCNDFTDTITMLENMPTVETIFVIGGEMVYQQAIKHAKCSKIYLNKVHVVCDLTNSDTFFPAVDTNIYDLIEERHDDPTVSNYVYVRKQDM